MYFNSKKEAEKAITIIGLTLTFLSIIGACACLHTTYSIVVGDYGLFPKIAGCIMYGFGLIVFTMMGVALTMRFDDYIEELSSHYVKE